MHYAKVYVCLEQNVVFIYHLSPENMQTYSKPCFIEKLFNTLHFALVEFSDQFNAE